jgi:hypothetical protein
VAAPSYVSAGVGATDAGGAWAFNQGGPATGNVVIIQILQDGTTNGALTSFVFGNVANLAGTSSAATQIPGPNGDGSWPIGSPAAARQFLWICRAENSIGVQFSGANSTSEDLYARIYEFTDVSTGTTLSTVIENGTAGNAVNGAATSATCADTAVTTLGVDRLACNFGAINDDASGIAVFAGASGGTWTDFQSYESASGTDGTVFFEDCSLAAAGTIDGGTDTIVSLAWGVVGFALIGTTPAGPAPLARPINTEMQAVSRSNVY